MLWSIVSNKCLFIIPNPIRIHFSKPELDAAKMLWFNWWTERERGNCAAKHDTKVHGMKIHGMKIHGTKVRHRAWLLIRWSYKNLVRILQSERDRTAQRGTVRYIMNGNIWYGKTRYRVSKIWEIKRDKNKNKTR